MMPTPVLGMWHAQGECGGSQSRPNGLIRSLSELLDLPFGGRAAIR